MHSKAGAIQVVVLVLLALLPTAGHAQLVYARLTTSITDQQFAAGAQAPSISPDGRYVALVSSSANIGPAANGSFNVYRYDLVLDEYVLAMEVLGSGNSSAPSISADGLAVAFESLADNIAPGTPSGVADLFYSGAFDAGGGAVGFTTVQVSKGLAGAPNGESRYASVSADGRWVAFHSAASNLIVGDTNSAPDIFVGDALGGFAGAPERISVDDGEAQIAGPSRALSPSAISSDGRLVAFSVDTPVSIDGSNAGTLEDVFVRDRTAGTTRLVSKASNGSAGNSSSDQAAISPNGRFVAFRSFSSNLVVASSGSRIYVRDLQLGTTTNMPLPPGAENCEDPRVSDTADLVVQCNMTSPVAQQAILYRASQGGGLFLLSTSTGFDNGNGTSGNFSGISADGNLMVFDSAASDLVANDSNAATDVFIAVDLVFLNAVFADGFE